MLHDGRMRYGLLGTGYWATVTQAAALAAHDEATFAGVWGRDPAKAEALAQQHGVRAYSDVDALLADVDAVAIALPPDVQAALALRAAEAGKHLLLDKPVALTLDAADRLVAAADAHGVASLVFFTGRFDPAIATFLTSAQDGGWYAAHGTWYGSIYTPGNPYGQSVWRRQHGGLWDVGPHALAYVLPLLGPVTEVSAVIGSRQTAHLLLGHAGGAASTVSLTLDAAPGASAHGFAFYGEQGTAELPAMTRSADANFGTALSTLEALVRDGAQHHPCDARFGRAVVAILAAAETSAAERRIVTL
jgi:predicted dehydrogenase